MTIRARSQKRITLSLITAVGLGTTAGQGHASVPDLTDFSIEDLMQVRVVSAAKVEQPLHDTAAAVFVITPSDIRRSGATSVMEALRLAPGVQVARLDASRWAITIRGFNGRFANKLLVLVDGRSVYAPQYSGVYWEVQDVPLDDIQRIEVIRGPGGTLWGANAVNGVINIITKSSKDTQGGLVSITAGNENRAIAAARYGGALGDEAHYRVFGQFSERDGMVTPEGRDARDDWSLGKGGFRVDWTPSQADSVTVQGEYYAADLDQNLTVSGLVPPYRLARLSEVDTSGGSLQARWGRWLSATSQIAAKAYYQHEERADILYESDSDTYDLDFQHNFAWGERHEFVWGAGYRHIRDGFEDTQYARVRPRRQSNGVFSAFVQDQVELIPERFRVIGGIKLEHNDFTGWEWQPSARVLWTLHADHRVWGAVSRAVRTPSRGERDGDADAYALAPSPLSGNLPVLMSLRGSGDLESEKLTAYEIGYRGRLAERLSIDATAFYSDYDEVVTATPGTPSLDRRGMPYLAVPVPIKNQASGSTQGVEVALDWNPTEHWRLRAAHSYLDSDIKNELTGADAYANGVSQQTSLQASWNPRDDVEVDLWWSHVGNIETPAITSSAPVEIDSYSKLTLRLGWRPRKDLELSLVGTDLLDDHHLELVQEAYAFPVEVERSLYGQVKWSF